MSFDVLIKSGICGHSDYDNCDLVIAKIENCSVPRENEVIKISQHIDGWWKDEVYLVREIEHIYIEDKNDKTWREFIRVYVIKIY